ncbi:DNA repair protein complementing XP-G cells [Sergentomyia squamirostris]
MGVLGLWKLLEPSGKPVPLETLENKRLAIDISIWLHQVVKGFQDSKGGTLPNAHLLGLFHRLCKLLYYRIKPVFVFDGGVPILKRQTIKKRQDNKKKFLNSADHLQELLLAALAKEKVVQQVLGDAAPLLTKSPKKKVEEEAKPSRDDMFKLPEIEEPTSTVTLDEGFEEKKTHVNLHSIDVKSAAFRALPADKRYEILTDLKETRKQSSWGRLHELPVQSNDFATFQMERLLKRRQVQLSLEEAEKDMGGATLSFAELEKMLKEEGVLAEASSSKGQRIANDNVTKFVFVRDLKKALEQAKQMESKAESASVDGGSSSDLGLEFDNNLQKAIAMSLEDPEEDEEEESDGAVRMSEEQKKFLKGTAVSLARAYMIEFGGMSSEDVEELFKESEGDQSIENETITEPTEESPEKLPSEEKDLPDQQEPSSSNQNPQPPIEIMSSDSDSDFEEVPPEEPSSSQSSLQVVINPKELPESLEDDIFSDIFSEETPTVQSEAPEASSSRAAVSTQKDILAELKQQKDAIPKITLDDLNVESTSSSKPDTVSEQVIEISDTEEEKTPKKVKKSMNDYFEIVSPSSSKEKKIEEDVPKVTSPFFVKKSPRSGKSPGKSPAKDQKERLNITKELFPDSSSTSDLQDSIKLLDPEDKEKLTELRKDLAKETKELETERNKQERLGVSITEKMSYECKQLLKLFGIPYVVAPMEAEAQCAFMNSVGLTDGSITDDSDIWLFGGKTVYKNFFDQRKHVLEYRMEKIEQLFHVDRDKLIQMAMLVGSDYTVGINGIGAVTALEILAQFPTTQDTETDLARLSGLRNFRDWYHAGRHTSTKRTVLKGKLNNIVINEGFPNVHVLRAYLYPEVDDSEEDFVWGNPDVESIKEFAKKNFGWPTTRTEELLNPVLKKLKERKVQSSIRNYFNTLTPRSTTELKVSKRVRKAIDHLSGDPEAGSSMEEAVKKPRKKTVKSSAASTEVSEKKPIRKRKSKSPEPSTSGGFEKIPRIPNTKAKIPQRERDLKEAEEKRQKAIEIFKKNA